MQYAETAALLAVMEEDDVKLQELLDDMLPGELLAFRRQVFTLLRKVDAELDRVARRR